MNLILRVIGNLCLIVIGVCLLVSLLFFVPERYLLNIILILGILQIMNVHALNKKITDIVFALAEKEAKKGGGG